MTEQIELSKIVKDKCNVRKDDADITEMVGNIKKLGVLQPAIVRPVNGNYGAVIGWSRIRAAKEAGFETFPCDIRNWTDREAQLASLSENLMRNDLSLMDRANAINKALLNTHQKLADEMGTTLSLIEYWLAPLQWQPETQELVSEGKIPINVARDIRSYAKKDANKDEKIAAEKEIKIAEVFAKKDKDDKPLLPERKAHTFFDNAKRNETSTEDLIKKLNELRDPDIEINQPVDIQEGDEEPILKSQWVEFALDSDVVDLINKWRVPIHDKINDILREYLRIGGYV